MSGLLFAVIIFTVYFFRDPIRPIPPDPTLILAPADGEIVGIEEMESPFGLGKRRRIAIFLSVFDVHVNRMPTDGTVAAIESHAGQFLDVRDPQASLVNEHVNWKISTSHGPIVIRQIAGLIARRILPWAKVGDNIQRGELIGMIRFGSRTELFLPLECEILVKVGDLARGVSTPLARWKNS